MKKKHDDSEQFNAAFIQAARDAIRWLAEDRHFFTADDVWKLMDEDNHCPEVTDPRVMGRIMRDQRLAGIIAPTGRYVPSVMPSRNRGPARVWESNL